MAAATGDRILDAAETAISERPLNEITLATIAERSGVTVQTILRHFKNRRGLTEAALTRFAAQVGKRRRVPTPGDVPDAVAALLDHYDEIGEAVLRLLIEEGRYPVLRALADFGRRHHRDWCAAAFAPSLQDIAGVERERRLAQLVAITDVQVWNVLHHQRGLSRQQTELALCELLAPLMEPRS